MPDFGTDLFNSLTGQKTAPQQTIIPTQDLLSQSYTMGTALAPQVIGYNQALAPGLTDVQLGVERQYDPNIAALRSTTSKSILDQLNMGSAIPQDLQDQIINNALAGTARSGFGVGQGARGLVAADLGLTGLQLQNQRQGNAASYVRGSPSLNSLYQPYRGVGPEAIASDLRDVQAARDDYENLKEDIRQKNFAALLNTGGRIIGTAAGAYFGGPAGAKIGGDIGGSLVTGGGVRGQEAPATGGGGMGGMFSGLFSGMGGGGGSTGGSFGSGGGGGAISNFGSGSTSLNSSVPTNGPFR